MILVTCFLNNENELFAKNTFAIPFLKHQREVEREKKGY